MIMFVAVLVYALETNPKDVTVNNLFNGFYWGVVSPFSFLETFLFTIFHILLYYFAFSSAEFFFLHISLPTILHLSNFIFSLELWPSNSSSLHQPNDAPILISASPSVASWYEIHLMFFNN